MILIIKLLLFLFYKRNDLMSKYELYNGDCLEIMDKLIEEYPTY